MTDTSNTSPKDETLKVSQEKHDTQSASAQLVDDGIVPFVDDLAKLKEKR